MSQSTAMDVFTISSNNYLGMARVFADSYLNHHPDGRVWVCLVDRPDDRIPYEEFPFETVPVEDLEIPMFQNMAFRYDILELNTAVKPFFFKYLRDVVGLRRASYFDPDIFVNDRLSVLEKALDDNLAVLTPHVTAPLDNRFRPSERVIRQCGIYNLGYLGLSLEPETSEFLDWWCDRLHRFCRVDLANGIFVDQSWMDFAPAYLSAVAIIRDPEFNVAYWNLPHRLPQMKDGVWVVDGRRVGFFHFSGVDLYDLDAISKHQNRLNLSARPELRRLFEDYRRLVERSGQEELREVSYSWERFSGTEITIPPFARTALQEVDPNAVRWPDPFDGTSNDSFLAWLLRPVPIRGCLGQRAALYLWQYRSDIRDEFPNIFTQDLSRFLSWYVEGGAKEAGLHKAFYQPLQEHLGRFDQGRPVVDEELERAARIDLSNPGPDKSWLNEAAAEQGSTHLTRLATLIYRTRPDVAATYPRSSTVHESNLAYWMAIHGRLDYRLHDDLVRPMLGSLPITSRLTAKLRALLPWNRSRTRFVLPKSDDEELEARRKEQRVYDLAVGVGTPHAGPPSAGAGVNLVGLLEGDGRVTGFADSIGESLEKAGVPHVPVDIGRDRSQEQAPAYARLPDGAPFSTTILAITPDLWTWAIDRLPIGARVGRRLIGYCSDRYESIGQTLDTRIDEIWVPTAAGLECLRDLSPVPVNWVPPAMSDLEGCEKPSWLDLEHREVWLALHIRSRTSDEWPQASKAIECIRQLQARGVTSVGLCLIVEQGGGDLVNQLRHLPVHVIARPLAAGELRGVLTACQGLLHLAPPAAVGPAALEAMLAGMPIIGWNGLSSPTLVGELAGGKSTAEEGEQESPCRLEDVIATILTLVEDPNSAARASGVLRDLAASRFASAEVLEPWKACSALSTGTGPGRRVESV